MEAVGNDEKDLLSLQQQQQRPIPESGIHWSEMFASRSRFRHVFGSPASRDQCYDGIRVATSSTSHDATLCAVNNKFLAVVVESSGGGVFMVIPLHQTGRIDCTTRRVCGHGAPINDLKWYPFDDNVIASCSDDATVKLWTIPDGGIKGNLNQWTIELTGHSKRVTHCHWHPSTADILLTSGYDFKCIVWNTRTASPVRVISVHDDVIFCITWNRNGSLFATTCKDGYLRVIEPRSGSVISKGRCHEGVGRMFKAVFVEGSNRLLTTGVSRSGERQFTLWETNGSSLTQLKSEDLDSSSSILMPFYDSDTHIIFLAGKGDGNIRYYEVICDPPYIRSLSQFQSQSPQRDLAMMPKRGVDPMKGEIARFYKIHASKDLCEPVSMIIPRKTERFQPEIFPPTASNVPALTAEQWLSNIDKDPILAPLMDINDNMLSSAAIKVHLNGYQISTAHRTFSHPSETEIETTTMSDLKTEPDTQADRSTRSSSVIGMIRQYEQISSSTDNKVYRSASFRINQTSKTEYPRQTSTTVVGRLETATSVDDLQFRVPATEELKQTLGRNGRDDSKLDQSATEVDQKHFEKKSSAPLVNAKWSSCEQLTSRHHETFTEISTDDVIDDSYWISHDEPPSDTVIRPSRFRRSMRAAIPYRQPPSSIPTDISGTSRVTDYDNLDGVHNGTDLVDVGQPDDGAGDQRLSGRLTRTGSANGKAGHTPVGREQLGDQVLHSAQSSNRTTVTDTNGLASSEKDLTRIKQPTDHRDILEKYFLQLEEIKTLKEQLSCKDKKIRRLEDQLLLLRTNGGSSWKSDRTSRSKTT